MGCPIHTVRRLVTTLVLCIAGGACCSLALLPGTADAQPGDSQLRPIAPPDEPPGPPSSGSAEIDDLDDPIYPSSPVGASALRRGQLGLRLEVGYPFVELAVTVGLVTGRLQVEAGYRGLYGMTNAIFGGLKWVISRSRSGRTGVALRLIGGYSDIRKDDGRFQEYQNMAGGGFGFGEGGLLFTARGRSNAAFLASAGLRISQYRPRECNPGPDCEGNRKVAYAAFLELGFVKRLGWRTSYYMAVGVDVFEGLQEWLPALIRLRIGISVDL